jgi:hypothetical protein
VVLAAGWWHSRRRVLRRFAFALVRQPRQVADVIEHETCENAMKRAIRKWQSLCEIVRDEPDAIPARLATRLGHHPLAEVHRRYGTPIKSLRRAWKTACKDAGRPGLLLHDLRRSAVRTLERAGISRSVAMKLTGHKTEAVYRRYAIVAESDLLEAGTKLAATLGTMPETVSHSDNSGDNSVTAWRGRSLSG